MKGAGSAAFGEGFAYEVDSGKVHVDLGLKQERGWLAQRGMAEVGTTKGSLVVRREGKREVRRRINHYDLGAIISVARRTSSRCVVRFRQCATHTLPEHLVRGYAMNEKRLAERGLQEVRETLKLLEKPRG